MHRSRNIPCGSSTNPGSPVPQIRSRTCASALMACIMLVSLTACGGSGPSGYFLSESIAQESSSEAPKDVSTAPTDIVATATTQAKATKSRGTPSPAPATSSADPTPTSAATSVGIVNSIDTIIGDMSLENDARLDGIPDFMWAVGPNPAAVVMGADPRGCKMPSWWLTMPAVKAEYKDCDLWTRFIQWFVIYEGVGNAGHNVRVETRRPKTYYLSKSTGRWILLGQHAGTSWFPAAKSNIIGTDGSVDERTNADGSVAIKIPVKSSYVHHGIWPLGIVDISTIVADIAAIFSTVQARLIVDDSNRPDDRPSAVLLMNSGADYYPTAGSTAADSFPPGVGTSRAKRITSEWQSFNFATISAARQDYTGASASIPTEVFRANPPPLD